MNVSVRPATNHDTNSLMDIDLKSYDYPWDVDKWRELTADPLCKIFIATFMVKPIGFIAWLKKPVDKELEILRLAVKPDYRNKGIGTLLVGAAEIGAQEDGLSQVTIVVPEIWCHPSMPYDISGWLVKLGFEARIPIIRDYTVLYGKTVDGFKFAREV